MTSRLPNRLPFTQGASRAPILAACLRRAIPTYRTRNANPIGKLIDEPTSKVHGGKEKPDFVTNRRRENTPKDREPANGTVRPRKVIPGVVMVIYFQRQVVVTGVSTDRYDRGRAGANILQNISSSLSVPKVVSLHPSPSGFIPHAAPHDLLDQQRRYVRWIRTDRASRLRVWHRLCA